MSVLSQRLQKQHLAVYILVGVVILAALIHLLPFLAAQWQTPPGYTFTGNLNTSPDAMQYYSWARQTQREGVVVTNKFTTEANEPHLVVFFYFLIGQISAGTGASPEFVYVFVGGVLAAGLAILLFLIARQFMMPGRPLWWVFGLLLLGGGFGPLLRILIRYDFIRENLLLRRTIVEGMWRSIQFESLRGQYIFQTLFDTHFLWLWLVTAVALFALYHTFASFSWGRAALTGFLFAFATMTHVYEGVNLIVILAAMLFLFWRKGLLDREKWLTAVAALAGVLISFGWQAYLFASSGLPLTEWREVNILISAVFLAFPLAWVIIAWGIGEFWQTAGLKETFLLGWAAGCLLIIFSAPFYPYPTRGTLTLQIPVYLIAGLIYFRRRERVTKLGLLILAGTTLVAPVWVLENWMERAQFSPDEPHKFLSEDHRLITEALADTAVPGDVLLARESQLLWLAPSHPGKHFCAHFFLTVDYEQKCAAARQFFTDPPEAQMAFLQAQDIDWVYVDAADDPAMFKELPGMELVQETAVGGLFRYHAPRSEQ